MEIASWLGTYAGGTEYDEGRPYISAIDGPGGPIITADHLTRDTTCVLELKPRLIISTVIVCVMNCSAPNRRMKID